MMKGLSVRWRQGLLFWPIFCQFFSPITRPDSIHRASKLFNRCTPALPAFRLIQFYSLQPNFYNFSKEQRTLLRELRPMIGRCYKALAYKVGLSNHVSRSIGRHTVSVALTLKVQHLLSSCSGSKSFHMSVSIDGYV